VELETSLRSLHSDVESAFDTIRNSLQAISSRFGAKNVASKCMTENAAECSVGHLINESLKILSRCVSKTKYSSNTMDLASYQTNYQDGLASVKSALEKLKTCHKPPRSELTCEVSGKTVEMSRLKSQIDDYEAVILELNTDVIKLQRGQSRSMRSLTTVTLDRIFVNTSAQTGRQAIQCQVPMISNTVSQHYLYPCSNRFSLDNIPFARNLCRRVF